MKSSYFHVSIYRLAAGVACTALAVGSHAAFAQAAETGNAAQADASGVQDIVVTAQRRSESVSKVPISIQVLTAEALSRQQVIDTRDLVTFTPTVSFTNIAGAMVTSFGLRGVASNATAPGVQPSVALIVDGVPVYNQGEFISGLGDIERVEILNGPQGTLFGKNSTAGVINIVTKSPTAKFEAGIEASTTTDNETYLHGMVNTPLSDSIRLRVNGFYQHLSPQVKNLSGGDVFGSKAFGFNGKLAIDLSPNATFTVASTYTRNQSSQSQYIIVGPSILDGIATALGVTIPTGVGGTTVNMNTDAKDVYVTKNVRGTLDWKASDNLTVTSITNYTDFSDKYLLDGDGTPFGADLGAGERYPGAAYPFQGQNAGYGYQQRTKYFSQELRGNLKAGIFDVVVGGFYQHVRLRFKQFTPYKFSGIFTPPTGDAYFSATQFDSPYTNKTGAIFGDVNASVQPWLKIFGGLRYTWETVDQHYNRYNYFGPYSDYNPVTGVFVGTPVVTSISGKQSIGNLSGRAGIQFQPNDNVNIYASFAKGYKGPAANNNDGLSPGQSVTLNPEKATAYEIGFKLRLLDNRLAINAAAFHEVIKDLQISANDPTQPGVATLLLNAGKITSKGIEGDMSVAPTTGLRLSLAAAYVDAVYGGFTLPCNTVQIATGTCPNYNGVPGLLNADGLRASTAPKFRYTLSASYEQPVSDSLRIFGQTSWTHSSSMYTNQDNNPLTLEPPHGQLNASLGLGTIDGRWEVEVFGKNILSDFYYSARIVIAPIGLPVGFLPRDYHRYAGIRVKSRF